MPALYTNAFSYLLYSIAFISMNVLEASLIIRDLLYWKKGDLDDTKTYKKDWISVISLTLIVWAAMNLSIYVSIHIKAAQINMNMWIPISIGLCLIALGLLLRIMCVKKLGNFFRLLVIVQKNHRIITTGPYRYVRHPSYTAALLILLGFGFCFTNWISVCICIVLPVAAYLMRIRVEEAVMIDHFAKEYKAYQQRTPWQVIPYVL